MKDYPGLPELFRGLMPLQYGHKLLENIGLPPITSNVKLMGDCISSVAKAHKIRPDQAYCWLYKRAQFAQECGEKVNFLWFSNGEYNNSRVGIEPVRSTFIPVDRKALEAEQNTPEWAAAAANLRAKFANLAGKVQFPGGEKTKTEVAKP